MKRYTIFFFVLFLFSGVYLMAQNMSNVTIYINPGHGGNDSDDRNVTISPFSQGDPLGFWESQSNLDKGLQLRDMLQKCGAKVFMSRTTNTTADDLALSKIVALSNASDADFMLAIHSNAGGTANMVLQLYSGVDPGDTHTYTTPTYHSEEGYNICTIIAKNLYSNEANVWGNNYSVRGDKTFGRTAMDGWSDGYGVLRGLMTPGAISEGSMHDYIPETYRLMNMEYKWLEAWHFLKSFATYYNCGEIPTGNIVGTIHDSHFKNEAGYAKIANSRDLLLPLNKAKVTLNPGNLVYTTDELNNGVYVFKNLQPGTYTLKYEADPYYSQEQSIVVKANTTTYNNVFLDKIRLTPPEVIAYSPKVAIDEPVLCTTPITFEFNWDIDEASAAQAFSIIPAIDGKITFEDSDHLMIFTPTSPYEVSTIYTVKLDKSLKHPGNITMTDDFSFQFLTNPRNRLALLSSFPNKDNQIVHYETPSFLFIFDRTLEPILVKDNINIYDAQGNLCSKNSRSQLNNKYPFPLGSAFFKLSSSLTPGQAYVMKVSAVLKDDQGTPVYTPIEYAFTAQDVRVTQGTVGCNFENDQLFTYNTSLSNASSAKVARSSSKLFDSYAYEFTYEFTSGGTAIYDFVESPLTIKGDKCIGLHLLGDLSGNQLDLIWADNQQPESRIYTPFTSCDFWGWQYREGSFAQLDPDHSYRLLGIRISQKNTPLSTKGDLYLDNLLVLDQLTSIAKTSEDALQVYPNPVRDVLTIEGNFATTPVLSLFTLEGQLILSAEGKTLNVQTLIPGNYLLKIQGNGVCYVKQIIIQ